MSAFDDLRELPLRRIWDGINARLVNGERLSLGVVELDPGAVAREHSHEHEQLGMVIRGAMTFRIGDETRELWPGGDVDDPVEHPARGDGRPRGCAGDRRLRTRARGLGLARRSGPARTALAVAERYAVSSRSFRSAFAVPGQRSVLAASPESHHR